MSKTIKKYYLYVNEETLELVLSPYTDKFIGGLVTDEVRRYNRHHYICTDRKKLREYANSIKARWLEEARERLEKLEKLQLKNKY